MQIPSIDSVREEPVTTLGSMVGVVLIVALLWAFGAVAQGQVKRAQVRNAQAAEQKTVSQRCLRKESDATATCGAVSNVDAVRFDAGRVAARVSVAYR